MKIKIITDSASNMQALEGVDFESVRFYAEKGGLMVGFEV